MDAKVDAGVWECNTAISRCVSRLELMLSIREIAARLERLHPKQDWWDRVQREALRAGNPFSQEVPGFAAFVRVLSGGLQNPWILFELREFVRQCQSSKIVRAPFLQAVAELLMKTCLLYTSPSPRD